MIPGRLAQSPAKALLLTSSDSSHLDCLSSTTWTASAHDSTLGSAMPTLVELAKTSVSWPSRRRFYMFDGESSMYRSAPTAALSVMKHRSQ